MPQFICPECGRQCTRSSSSGIEYGHQRRKNGDGKDRCPRRPECVDPVRDSEAIKAGKRGEGRIGPGVVL